MSLAALPESGIKKNVRERLAKSAFLLIIALGLFWFSEKFSPAAIFEPGSNGWVLWMSYAKDLIQPFAFYFFICLGERWLPNWRYRALLTLAIPVLLETGQFLYYRISSGRYLGVFDPLDIVVYIIGVGLAVILDQKVLAKSIKFWY